MRVLTLAAGLVAGIALGAGATHFVMAQDAMPGMDHSKMDYGTMSPASMGYRMAMGRMMKETPPQTGNADVDFVAGMGTTA